MGALEHLVIQAWRDPDFAESSFVGRWQAPVNPHELTLAWEHEYDDAQGAGTTGTRMDFKRVKPGDLSLSFFLDGTGANGRPLEVQHAVDEFRRVTGYAGEIHRTHHLLLAWGTLPVRRCVLKSASVTYKLFRPDGSPLRAVIAAVFVDASTDRERVARAGDESPDLTHVRVLAAHDTLALLCQRIYGDATLALQVAHVNGLPSARGVPVGTRLRFPPLARGPADGPRR